MGAQALYLTLIIGQQKGGGGKEMTADKDKLKDLILYILQNYNNTYLTETKLQKLLYFCDFNYFYDKEDAITGYAYRKNHHGPTIMDLPSILAEMEKEEMIRVVPGINYYGSPQKNFSVAKTREDIEKVFNSDELLTINEVNEAYKNLKPSELELLSHRDFPFMATDSKSEVIDYELVKYRDEDEDEEIDENAAKLFESPEFSSLLKKIEAKL